MAGTVERRSGPQYPIESVDRALRLLLMFQERNAIRIVDAAGELGVSPSTVHRLLAMLVEYGFVRKNEPDRTYAAGEVLVDIGVRAVGSLDISALARPSIAEAVANLGETVELGVLRDREILSLCEVEGDQLVQVRSQLGRRIAAFSSAIGRVHLADFSEDHLRSLYRSVVIRDPLSGVKMTRAHLETTLAEVRKQGFATNRPFEHAGFLSLAVPVRRDGRVIAGVGVAIPMQRLDATREYRAVTVLTDAAHKIESAIERKSAT